MSCRAGNLENAECVCGGVKRIVVVFYIRRWGNHSAGRNMAKVKSSQFANPKSDCLPVESLEDIPMRFEEC